MPVAPLHIILGDDEFLAERARISVQRAVAEDMGAQPEVTYLSAATCTSGEIIEATSPSLFGDNRLIVFEDAQKAGKEASAKIIEACGSLMPGITIIVAYSVSKKNFKARKKPPELVAKLQRQAQLHEVFELYPNERLAWVKQEFASHGVNPTPDVLHSLLESVGSNLRELASAIGQLVSDTNGNVTREAVHTYYVGTAEVEGWDIADAAVSGNVGSAVASCRRALQLGTSPVVLSMALAAKVGEIARLYNVSGGNHNALAGQLGMNPYKVKLTLPIARRWSSDAVTKAVILMAEVDAQVKGQGGDPEFVIEDAVRKIAMLAR